MKKIYMNHLKNIIKELKKNKYTILLIIGTITLFPMMTNVYIQYTVEPLSYKTLVAVFGSWLIVLITTLLLLMTIAGIVIFVVSILEWIKMLKSNKISRKEKLEEHLKR